MDLGGWVTIYSSMLVYLETDLFASPAQTLVNTVNTVGVMGKGIAKTFKERYPEMFAEYKRLCEQKRFGIGSLMLWRGADHWVLNFPTKTTWRLPSKLSYIEEGLKKLAASYDDLGITSISFPLLGCGNGNLDWSEVKPLMERYLRDLSIPVYIHDRHVGTSFVPEHLEGTTAGPARDLRRFLCDLEELTSGPGREFTTLDPQERFRASVLENGDLKVDTDERSETIPHEEVAAAWSELQSGLLTMGPGREASPLLDRYLFAVLAGLPYVRHAPIRHLDRGQYRSGHGLFLQRRTAPPHIAAQRRQTQGKLWP